MWNAQEGAFRFYMAMESIAVEVAPTDSRPIRQSIGHGIRYPCGSRFSGDSRGSAAGMR